jgi:hypothetical protein
MLSMGWAAAAAVREPVRFADSSLPYGSSWGSTGGGAYLFDMSADRPRLWTPQGLADFTRIPIRTLADWRTERARSRGLGLPFVALSAHNVRYRDEDIEAFIAGRVVAPMDRAAD